MVTVKHLLKDYVCEYLIFCPRYVDYKKICVCHCVRVLIYIYIFHKLVSPSHYHHVMDIVGIRYKPTLPYNIYIYCI